MNTGAVLRRFTVLVCLLLPLLSCQYFVEKEPPSGFDAGVGVTSEPTLISQAGLDPETSPNEAANTATAHPIISQSATPAANTSPQGIKMVK